MQGGENQLRGRGHGRKGQRGDSGSPSPSRSVRGRSTGQYSSKNDSAPKTPNDAATTKMILPQKPPTTPLPRRVVETSSTAAAMARKDGEVIHPPLEAFLADPLGNIPHQDGPPNQSKFQQRRPCLYLPTIFKWR